YVVGDPLDARTYIGPLARREAALGLLEGQVADAVARGARVLTGGRRLDRPGFFFAPTVLVDADHAMRVMREETFGPLVGLARVARTCSIVSRMRVWRSHDASSGARGHPSRSAPSAPPPPPHFASTHKSLRSGSAGCKLVKPSLAARRHPVLYGAGPNEATMSTAMRARRLARRERGRAGRGRGDG